MKKIALAAALAALGATAFAAEPSTLGNGMYGELSYSSVKMKGNGWSFKPTMLRGMIGTNLNSNFAIESMIGFGMSDSSQNNTTIKINNAFGFFLKPQYQVSEQFTVYGRLGYARLGLKESGVNSQTGNHSKMAYGFGASYNVSPTVSLTADYLNFGKKDGVKVDSMNFGAGFKF